MRLACGREHHVPNIDPGWRSPTINIPCEMTPPDPDGTAVDSIVQAHTLNRVDYVDSRTGRSWKEWRETPESIGRFTTCGSWTTIDRGLTSIHFSPIRTRSGKYTIGKLINDGYSSSHLPAPWPYTPTGALNPVYAFEFGSLFKKGLTA